MSEEGSLLVVIIVGSVGHVEGVGAWEAIETTPVF